jgi:hypothetical protein
MGGTPAQWLQRIVEVAAREEKVSMDEAIETVAVSFQKAVNESPGGGDEAQPVVQSSATVVHPQEAPASFQLAQNQTGERISTGIPEVDEVMADGIPPSQLTPAAAEREAAFDETTEQREAELKRLLKNELRKDDSTIYVVKKRERGAVTSWTAYVVQRSGMLALRDITGDEWDVTLYNPNSKAELEVVAMIATKAGVDRDRISEIRAVVL